MSELKTGQPSGKQGISVTRTEAQAGDKRDATNYTLITQYRTRHKQWWILGEADDAGASGPPFKMACLVLGYFVAF